MLNLIKYEFSKKYRMFTALIAATVLANLFLTLKFGEVGLGILAGLLSVGLLVLYAVDVIKMYSQDINSVTGYMVFMTPNSGYKVIGAKVMTALIEGFLMIVFFLAVITLNSVVIYGFGNLNNVRMFSIDIPFEHLLSYLAIILTAILLLVVQFIMSIYAAITLSKSILSNSKYKGVISFVIFMGINYIASQIYLMIDRIFGFTEISSNVSPGTLLLNISPSMITAAVLSGVLVYLSGYLLEKKINL